MFIEKLAFAVLLTAVVAVIFRLNLWYWRRRAEMPAAEKNREENDLRNSGDW